MIFLMFLGGLLIYLVIAVAVTIWLARRFATFVGKLSIALVSLLIFFLIPTGDEIAGSIYFRHLCVTETGVKIYRTIELSAEQWDEQGKPKFYDEKNGNFTLEGYNIEYAVGTYSPFFHVDNAGYKRIDKQSGQILGEVIDFRYWGGWMRRKLSPHNTASACEGRMERSNNLIKQIFNPKR